jgi:glyoxylase I family protein
MSAGESLQGVHHLGLTVRDAEASARWYVAVLGFDRIGAYTSPDGELRKVFLRHEGLAARIGLTEHVHAAGARFDEARTGLDHLAFGVGSRAELDRWAEGFVAANVVHSEIAASNSIPGAAVLVFRDPDNIQLELFFDPSGRAAEQ